MEWWVYCMKNMKLLVNFLKLQRIFILRIHCHGHYKVGFVLFLIFRAYFSHLLRAVSARNALFVEQNALFSTKNSKNAYCLGRCGIINVLNLNKWGIKIHNCLLILYFFLPFLPVFLTSMPLFSRISPVYIFTLYSLPYSVPFIYAVTVYISNCITIFVYWILGSDWMH